MNGLNQAYGKYKYIYLKLHIKLNKIKLRGLSKMTESDQFTKDKDLINNIRHKLEVEFDIHSDILEDNKIGIEEFNGYIDDDEKYEDIEALGNSICNCLRERFDNDFDYSLLESGYELAIQVI